MTNESRSYPLEGPRYGIALAVERGLYTSQPKPKGRHRRERSRAGDMSIGVQLAWTAVVMAGFAAVFWLFGPVGLVAAIVVFLVAAAVMS